MEKEIKIECPKGYEIDTEHSTFECIKFKAMNEIDLFCKKHNITKEQFYGNEIIDYSFDLGDLTSIPEGFNPTIGGSLWLDNLTSIHEGLNPKINGSLWLNSLTSIQETFNPKVGGSLYLKNLNSIHEAFKGKIIRID